MSDERENKPSMSRLYRLAHCAGSWLLELALRADGGDAPRKSNPWAEMGTRIHSALEGGLDPSTLNDSEYKVYARCVEQFEEVLDLVFSDQREELELIREERLWYGQREVSGQPDVVILKDGTCFIADYKTGRGDVEHADSNYQLRGLAVAAWRHYPDIQEVIVCIIQPLAEGDRKVTMARYDTDHLQAAERELQLILKRIQDPAAKRVPGFKQCQYCPAKTNCPEAIETMSELAVIDSTSTDLAERLPDLLARCKTAEQIIKGIRERAFEMLTEEPEAIEGWHLKQGSTRQSINDLGQLFLRLKEDYGIEASDFAGNCNITKTKITAMIRSASDLKGADLDAAVATALDGLTTVSRNRPSLAQIKT